VLGALPILMFGFMTLSAGAYVRALFVDRPDAPCSAAPSC